MKRNRQWRINKAFFSNPLLLIFLIGSCVLYTILDVRFSEEFGNSLDIAKTGSISSFRDFVRSLIMITLWALLARVVYCIVESYYKRSVLRATKNRAIEVIASKSPADYLTVGESAYSSFLINDLRLLSDNYLMSMVGTATDMIALVITLVALIRINWIASLFILVLSFLPLGLTKFMMGPVQGAFGTYSEKMEEYSNHLDEYLKGYREFTGFGAVAYVKGKHREHAEQLEKEKRHAYLKLDVMSNTIAIASISITIGVLLVGMFLALYGWLTVGEVFALSFISNGVTTPLSNLSESIPKLLSSKEITDKYNSLVHVDENRDLYRLEEPVHDIEVRDLSLAIGEKKLLDNVSVKFDEGRKYVLLGESGSGKSTLLKAIAGYWPGYEGEILINGHSSAGIDRNSLLNGLDMVPQKGVILDASVAENVSVFRDGLSEELIWDAIAKVGFDRRCSEFEAGQDEILTNDGEVLSGGERQRLALARALACDNRALFLDEATSALDHDSYTAVENLIVQQQRPIIISVEHRLDKDILEQYDRIIAMKNGQIVEQGTFAELIAQKGFFNMLYQKQQLENCE